VSGWDKKSLWVRAAENGASDTITIDLLGSFEDARTPTMYPFQSYVGGVGNINEWFGLTLDGDVLDKVQVRITAGAAKPAYVEILFIVSRMG